MLYKGRGEKRRKEWVWCQGECSYAEGLQHQRKCNYISPTKDNIAFKRISKTTKSFIPLNTRREQIWRRVLHLHIIPTSSDQDVGSLSRILITHRGNQNSGSLSGILVAHKGNQNVGLLSGILSAHRGDQNVGPLSGSLLPVEAIKMMGP